MVTCRKDVSGGMLVPDDCCLCPPAISCILYQYLLQRYHPEEEAEETCSTHYGEEGLITHIIVLARQPSAPCRDPMGDNPPRELPPLAGCRNAVVGGKQSEARTLVGPENGRCVGGDRKMSR